MLLGLSSQSIKTLERENAVEAIDYDFQVFERVYHYNDTANVYRSPKYIFKSPSLKLYLCTIESDSAVVLLPRSQVTVNCAFNVLAGKIPT